MKKYKGTNWQEFMKLLGDTAKENLGRELKGVFEFESMQYGYGRFGALESNYTLRIGRGLIDRVSGEKVFTIHDNNLEGMIPMVTIHHKGHLGERAYLVFNILRENLGMDIVVDYK